MNKRRAPAAAVLLPMAIMTGCGSSGRAGSRGELGVYDPDAGQGSFGPGDASASDDLDAHIEQNHIAVTFVSLGCSGNCADIQAVATGGNLPYHFEWSDGSTSSTRHVCPSSTTAYSVTVTDTGAAGEIARPPQVASARVTADVLVCGDGGAADSGAPLDASPGGLCLENLSFENSQPMTIHLRNTGIGGFDAPPWQQCDPNPDISGRDTYAEGPSPSDGQTFLNELSSTGVDESAGQNLCGTWAAGRVAHLMVDLTSDGTDGCTLQFFGATTAATAACPATLEMVGESAPIRSGGTTTYAPWSTQCVTLTPRSDLVFLELKPRPDCGSFLAIDNLRQVASCP